MNPEISNPRCDRNRETPCAGRASASGVHLPLLIPSSALRLGLAVLLLSLSAVASRAQWTTQVLALKAGWNAVYLEVDPEPVECDALFAGLPVESVWSWNKKFSSVQFIQDPDKLVPGAVEWLTWLPASHPAETLSSLFSLRGGQPYLIKVADAAAAFNLSVKGRPRVQPMDWVSDSYNFVGFPVSPTAPPTFQAFFAGSTNQAGKPIYRLNTTSGLWEQVSNPGTTAMRSGEAFWVRCDGRSTYSGPALVDIPGGLSLYYSWQSSELTLRFKNQSGAARVFSLKSLASLAAPAGWPALAGAIPFSYYATDLPNNQPGWVPLPASLNSPSLPAGGEWQVRVEARRRDMAPYAGAPGAGGAYYESLLEVTDGAGFRQLVGVTADGPNATGPKPGSAIHLAGGQPSPRAGLWVGNVVVQKVSQPSNIANPNAPLAVANALQFRILVHVDEGGQARLLQKVLQMWKQGTYKPDPSDATKQIVDVPGRFVLVTDDSLIPNFTGATLRDGDPVARRVSTVAYVAKNPVPLLGSGDFGANTIGATLVLDYDDPLNPFKHKYHPDHDNLTERFDQKLPEGQESFTLSRQITLQFSSTDPENLRLSGWGDTQIGGTYLETFQGVHKKPIYLQGTFRLNRASRVALLNDGL